jgi:hypothetical protein
MKLRRTVFVRKRFMYFYFVPDAPMKCPAGRALKSYTNLICGAFLRALPRPNRQGAGVGTRNHSASCGFSSVSCRSYCEHGAVSTFPASTRNAGAFAADAVDGSLDVVVDGDAELPDSSSVPVNSTFLPTWGLSAVGFAIRRYV